MSENLKLKHRIHSRYRGYEYIAVMGIRGIMYMKNGYVKIPSTHPYIAHLSKKKWHDFGLTSWKFQKYASEKAGVKFTTPKPKSHRRYKLDYDKVDVNVHGGLTFGDYIKADNINNWEHYQRFTPGYWIGWDYLHMGDAFYPKSENMVDPENREVYRKILQIDEDFGLLRKEKGKKHHSFYERHWRMSEIKTHCKDVIDQLIDADPSLKNRIVRYIQMAIDWINQR